MVKVAEKNHEPGLVGMIQDLIFFKTFPNALNNQLLYFNSFNIWSLAMAFAYSILKLGRGENKYLSISC